MRTDQLDGETDWKLRLSLPVSHQLATDQDLFTLNASITVEKPVKDIYTFNGTFCNETEGIEGEVCVT